MVNKNKLSFYLNKIVIFVMLLVSLFFFVACDDNDEENKPILILAYKPYSTEQVNPLNIFENYTYADLIKENLQELSTTILTGVANTYSISEMSETRLNEVDFQSLLNMSATPSEAKIKTLVSEFNSLTNIYVNTTDKVLILSNSSITPSSYITINEGNYYANTSLTKVSESGGSATSGNEIQANTVYKHGSGSDVTYIFVGGSVGSNIYIGSTSDYTNTKNYVSKLLSSFYNVIERDLTEINIIEGSSSDLTFSKWNYSLGEEVSLYEEYLVKYILKYNLSLQVELAKVMLVGREDLPTNLPTNLPDGSTAETNLKQVYETASSLTASESDKQKFIDQACLYLDHIGLSDVDAEMLIEAFFSKIIGTESFNASESNILFKNNYEDVLGEIFETVQILHKPKPILNFIIKNNASFVERPNVKGYLKSVILMAEKPIEAEIFQFVVLESETETNYDFAVYARYNDNSTVPIEANVLDANEMLNDDDTLVIDIADIFSKSCPLDNGNKDISVEDFAFESDRFTNSDGEKYNAWFYKKDIQFVEVVFATKNIFSSQALEIDMCGFGY